MGTDDVGGGGAVAQAGPAATEVAIAAAPRPLVDDPTGVLITGCRPSSPVFVRASVVVGGTRYAATASFDADATGAVDTSTAASRDGTYRGIDPFGLWWSGEPVDASGEAPAASSKDPLAPVQGRLTVENEGNVAASVLERHWIAPGVTVRDVREPGVSGIFARPAGAGPFPGVVAFAGSSGGLGGAATWAPVLASHGFAVLAIAYFGAPGLPGALVEIEVEVVERAIGWLLEHGEVAGDVAVMGMSRGSELALLAGALLEHVGAVVAFAPSGVAWNGLGPTGPVDAAAWTFRGTAVPYLAPMPPPGMAPGKPEGPLALRPIFEHALSDQAAVRAAEIPIERRDTPILLVSGEDDAMWPATAMSEIVVRRAARLGCADRVTSLSYPDAGHTCGGVPGLPVPAEVREHALDGGRYSFGGTRAGNARARADSWPRVVDFLARARR